MILRLVLFFISFFLYCCFGPAQTPFFHVNFETLENSETTEQISQTAMHINNQFGDPESFVGPIGNALRFDGHSTYIEHTGFDFKPQVNKQLAIECWYATEAFNQSSAGIIVQRNGNNGFSLKVRPFGKLLFQFFPDNTSYFIESQEAIPTYEWNHIVAQIDLNVNRAEIFINGQLAGEKVLEIHEEIVMASGTEPLYIGRDEFMPQTNGFVTSTANGAVESISLFDVAFSATQVLARYNEIGKVKTDLPIDLDIRHADDYLRPRYHFMPNTSWANEAYGFTFYNNQYHLFFQKNPNAPILNFMHWGHLSSPDLVNWKEEIMPLRPQEGFSSVGTWSGTTFFNLEGKPVIAYTGVNGAIAGIGIAEFQDEDLLDWNLIPENPVIDKAPSSIPNQDFRDPYIWLEDNVYYMVVGSGKANNGGGILMSYKSTDYINWELIDPIFETTLGIGGRFWEMPYFNKINDTDYLLVVTPQFVGQPARAIYWVGSFQNEKFEPHFDLPKDFEVLSRHLLSPAIGIDEAGRHSYIGIIPEDRNAQDQIAAGWRQTFSIPRVLRLLNDKETIAHYPHPNLCRARKNPILKENFEVIPNTSGNTAEYYGTQSELHYKLYYPGEENFEIHVYKNESGTEYTAITFNKAFNKIGIDRTDSSPFNTIEDNQFRDYIFNANDSIEVSIFLDHSILEVFIDNLAVMSARVYPSEESEHIDILVEGESSLEVIKFEAWDIDNKEVINIPEICEPEFLPDNFFTSIQSVSAQSEVDLVLFPNPTFDSLHYKFNGPLNSGNISKIQIYDQYGRLIKVRKNVLGTSSINIRELSNGVYYLVLDVQGRFYAEPFVIEK